MTPDQGEKNPIEIIYDLDFILLCIEGLFPWTVGHDGGLSHSGRA